MSLKNEVKELQKTLNDLEHKLGEEFLNQNISVESLNVMSELITEAKQMISRASANLKDLLKVNEIVTLVKSRF